MDMLESWAFILASTVENLGYSVANMLPSILVAIFLLLLGWVVGAGLGRIVAKAIDTLRVDTALRSAGIHRVFERTGHQLNAGRFVGALVKWFIIAVFFIAALEVLNLTQVTSFLSEIVFFYLPQVIVAVLIILIGAVVADFVHGIALASARAADIGSPFFVASIARWAVWIFAVLAALDQLSVASGFVQTLFTGVVVAISLALGLAFGLGGQQAAARYIDRVSSEFGRKRGGE